MTRTKTTAFAINRDPNAALTVAFGRTVTVDEMRLTLRADFPHDSWWTQATAEFSDGSCEMFSLQKSAQPQSLIFAPCTIESVTLKQLVKNEDASPLPALTQIEAWGTESGKI